MEDENVNAVVEEEEEHHSFTTFCLLLFLLNDANNAGDITVYRCSAIANEEVAPGEGALRIFRTKPSLGEPKNSNTKSSTNDPSFAIACARIPVCDSHLSTCLVVNQGVRGLSAFTVLLIDTSWIYSLMAVFALRQAYDNIKNVKIQYIYQTITKKKKKKKQIKKKFVRKKVNYEFARLQPPSYNY